MHSLILIATMSIVTIAIRFAPFILFSKGTPKAVTYLGEVLPYSIMTMLVVFCLKGISLVAKPYGIPELCSVALVIVLHKFKHNTLLSIIGGTALYMLYR